MRLYMIAPHLASIDCGALDPLDKPPINFDSAQMPILAEHWYGLRPDVAAQSIPDGNPRFQEGQAA